MQYQTNILQNEVYQNLKFLKEAESSIRDFIQERSGTDDYPGKYALWRLYFKKEKLIYINMNKCIFRENFLDGEVWIPIDKYEYLISNLQKITIADESKLIANFTDLHSDSNIESEKDKDKTPPTYFKINDLTFPFQEIVNTYGIPRYREVNPALFAIVTFPFLFGVMFGDIGHGFLLFLIGLYLIKDKDEIIASKSPLIAVLKARYLLTLMGFFAFYCGWMYNDFLSIPLNVFGSCYANVNLINYLI